LQDSLKSSWVDDRAKYKTNSLPILDATQSLSTKCEYLFFSFSLTPGVLPLQCLSVLLFSRRVECYSLHSHWTIFFPWRPLLAIKMQKLFH